jgi:hypothetical protein
MIDETISGQLMTPAMLHGQACCIAMALIIGVA